MRSTSDAPAKRRKKKKVKTPPTLIGWREWAAFPELGVDRIKAKIDTGAKTSAIHAFRVTTKKNCKGEEVAEFYLHPVQKRKDPEIHCRALVVDRRQIRSSNGQVQVRIIIRTLLRLGETEAPIDLSLSNRDDMGFRLLLGRNAFGRRFVINPGRSYLLGR